MVRKNLRGLVKNEPALLCIMLITVFSSALLLYFSYGLYQNYNVRLTEESTEYTELTLEVNPGMTLTKSGLCSFVEALPRETADNVAIFLATARSGSIADHRPVTEEVRAAIAERFGGNIMVDEAGNSSTFDENTVITDYNGAIFYFRFRYKDGGYKYIELPESALHDGRTLISGRFYSDEEYDTGAHVAVGSDIRFELSDILTEDGKAWLWGEEYELIGAAGANALPTPPLTAAPDDLALEPYLGLYFVKALNSTQYTDLKNTAEAVLPGMFRFEELTFPDRESAYVYSNIILISVLIALMSGINFVMLYRCILRRRRRTLAITRLCGCSLLRAGAGYVAECLVLGVPAFGAGLAVYVPLMKRRLSGLFPYMEAAYSLRIYAGIFAVYLAVLLLLLTVMTALSIRGSISAAVRKRG